MNNLCREAVSFLQSVYAEDSACFPFTTHLVAGEYRSVYEHPMSIRSTINCLLGLQEAAGHAPEHPFLRLTELHIERFLRLHEDSVVAPADLGLLLLLLSSGHSNVQTTRRILTRIEIIGLEGRRLRHMNVQDICWLLWGSVASAQKGLSEAEPVAHHWFNLLCGRFVASGAALPSHTTRPGRFGIVSFGACTYFLRALHEYATWCGSTPAANMFQRGLEAALAAQGPTGEWPWLLSNRDGRPLDFYPVFSVHQNSMSMLFLRPALDDGVADIEPTMRRSMEWMMGKNQLNVSMVQTDPFFICRSFERRARIPRAQRFLRALEVYATGRRASLAANDSLFINRESRSYELGWVLFAQSGNETIADIDLAS